MGRVPQGEISVLEPGKDATEKIVSLQAVDNSVEDS
jgi:hypothetical protein